MCSLTSVAFQDFAGGRTSWSTLNKLLDRLLAITKSQYGFIAEKAQVGGTIAVQIEAVTNIAWSPTLDKVGIARFTELTVEVSCSAWTLFSM